MTSLSYQTKLGRQLGGMKQGSGNGAAYNEIPSHAPDVNWRPSKRAKAKLPATSKKGKH